MAPRTTQAAQVDAATVRERAACAALERELSMTRGALAAASRREQAQAASQQRLAAYNDVLRALLGMSHSGLADRAATALQARLRGQLLRHALLLGRVAARRIQATLRGGRCRRQLRRRHAAAVPLQSAARHMLQARQARQRADCAASQIAAACRRARHRHAFLRQRRAAQRLQEAVRGFLTLLHAGPSRGQLRRQVGWLRRELNRLGVQPGRAVEPLPGDVRVATAAVPPLDASPMPTGDAADSPCDADATAYGGAMLTEQLEGGFRHAMTALTVFEVPDFLSNTSLVVESHVFGDSLGFHWRLWVKPYDKSGHVGLYLVPADDLECEHTADFELAIVGPRGRLWKRELRGGRAKLHKRTAGHGWPTFISREEIERGERRGDDSRAMLHHGALVVTASRITNVRPRVLDDGLAQGGAGADPLSRTL